MLVKLHRKASVTANTVSKTSVTGLIKRIVRVATHISVPISVGIFLTVQNSLHTLKSNVISLLENIFLTVQNSSHSLLSDNLTLTEVSAYEAETTALLARAETQPSDEIKTVINNAIIGLKANNGLSKADCCWVFSNYESVLSLQNWAKNDHNCSLVNAPVHDPGAGFTGDGLTNYINSDYVPSTDADQLQLGNESIIVMSPVLAVSDSRTLFGAQKTAAPITVFNMTFRTANFDLMYINSDGTSNNNINVAAGEYIGYIRDNTSVQGYKNGSPSGVADTVNQAALLPYQIKILANATNNTAGNFYNGQIGFLWLGGGLTPEEHAGIVSTMQTFNTELNALL